MKFFSLKYAELVIIIDPKAAAVESGIRMTKGLNGLYKQGKSAEFHNHYFETEDPRLIKIMKRHPGYGVSFIDPEEGMDEVAAENSRKSKNHKSEAAELAADTDHSKKSDK